RHRLAIGLIFVAAAGGLALLGCLHDSRSMARSVDAVAAATPSDENASSAGDSVQGEADRGDGSSTPRVIPVAAPGPKKTNPLDVERAYGYLRQICALGPRLSGSPGMSAQQKLLVEHFEHLGGKIVWQ